MNNNFRALNLNTFFWREWLSIQGTLRTFYGNKWIIKLNRFCNWSSKTIIVLFIGFGVNKIKRGKCCLIIQILDEYYILMTIV